MTSVTDRRGFIEDLAPRAACLVTATSKSNAGIVVDSLHFTRTSSPLADIVATNPQLIGNAQISDGPLTMPSNQQMFEAKDQRQIPGQ